MPTPPRRPARRPAARPTASPGSAGAAATAAGIALVTAAAVAAAVPDPDAAALPPAPVGTVDTGDGVRRSVSVWAPPGLTRSPVAFTISPDGRLWIAESDRAGNAVTDTRQLGHLDAVWEDGQLRTVEDRRRLIERWVAGGHFEPDFFTRTEDRVRMLADADGDGTADTASVFAGGFDDAVDGIAAGVLWVDDALLFTNVPALWALRDLDGDGTVDEDPASGERVALSTGYGIRWCFYGHDLHGLAHGPDGRVWFTMGDRGYNVVTPDGERLVGSDRGAVFRCWPDGSGLELVHEGLRNPQELAFDALGRPFTGDNNCDSGDRARVTLVLEGADSGWRQDVQSLPSRGPWNREGMWHLVESPDDLVDPARPAWVLPPIAHVGAGPAGFALQPGTGESGRHAGTLMLVDFYGSGATVHSFAMRPSGAWMELEDRGDYYRGATVTDIAWGPDGRLYMTDWGGGWSPNPNGRVLVVTNEDVHGDPEAAAELAAVRRWLEEGPEGHEEDALVAALDHADRRVRHAAQMELARRGGWRPTAAAPGERTDASQGVRERLVARLDAAGRTTGDAGPGEGADADAPSADLGALHATWALGQVARRDPAAARALLDRRHHADPIVRAQVVRTLADLAVPAPDGYAALLADPAAPVRGFAIRAVGRTGAAGFPGGAEAAPAALLAVAAGESDRDPVIRHELVVALARLADPEALADRYDAEDAGVAARLAVVLAARRQAIVRVGEDVPTRGPRAEARRALAPLLIRALDDASPRVSAAAARAIYDLNLGAPEPFTPLAADASGPPPVDATGPEAPSAFRALARSLASLPARRGHVIEPIVRRAIEANLRLGDVDPDAADRLVAFAAAASVPPSWRILALERVEAWAGGDRRERVWGHWIPRSARSTGPVEAALARHEPALRASSAGDAELRFRVDRLRARLLLTMSAAEVATVLADERRDPRFRAVLLEEAARRFPEAAGRLVTAALAVRAEAADVLRMAAMDVLAAGDRDPVRLLEVAAAAIEDGTVRERQHAAEHLGRLAAAVDGPAAPMAGAQLQTLLDVPIDGAANGEPAGDPLAPIRLELHRAAAAMPEGHPLRVRADALDARWTGRRPPGWGDELLAAGGDPLRGERIFRRHEAAQCLRCHAVRGSGAGMAGPALTAIATRRTIAELVEAVVEPGRTLVPGWGDVAAMPETTEVLTPAETRDVIAYLASLDDARSLPPPAGEGRARQFVVGTGAHVLALGLAIAISVAAIRLGRGAA